MRASDGSRSKGAKKRGRAKKPVEKSRKEQRKERRKLKKVARATYFAKKQELRKDGIPACKTQRSDVEPVFEKNTSDSTAKIESKKKRDEKKKRDLERRREKQRKLQLKEANEREDRVIKRLEKQLKLNKRKKKSVPKSFVADGLDYLLDFCVEENRKRVMETEACLVENESDTEFQNDLTTVLQGDETEDLSMNKCPGMSEDEDQEEFSSEMEDSDLEEPEFSSSTKRSSTKKDPTSQLSDSIEYNDDDDNDDVDDNIYNGNDNNSNGEDDDNDGRGGSDDDNEKDDDKDKNLWEDIYGRKRDKEGNVVREDKKYVPPAMRGQRADTHAEKLLALRRQLKGCVNRLAEHNVHNIANQIDELYMTNSRNDMNETLSKLMMEALVAPVLTPDRLISEHMMLIAILHANVGVEVGAHFLLTFVKKCQEMMREPQDVENKELDNVILMISHLYNFKVYGHRLLYQILDKLLKKFKEKEIELILLVLKSVGFLLRKDDPNALKEFIQKIQDKASGEEGENSRVRFMLDVLLAIKNNNVSKIPQYDPSHVEHLKKIVKSVIRKGNTITQFNVTLEDLLEAEERGKWWVVGSAWTGSNDANSRMKLLEEKKCMFGKKILELARKQRMNTDTRRNIFCVLMTAEDYLDAFEKLHHLGLKDQQEREVIHVLMHCSLQESKFNPYYAVLAQKLCDYERKYQLTIQYALWDKLKTIDEFSAKQLNNLARFLTHLFLEGGLALSVLKIVQFAELDKPTMKLLRQILLGILLHENEDACTRVFERISSSPQLQPFRESMRLFVNHFLVKNLSSSTTLDEHEVTLKRRAESVDKILTSRGSRVAF